MPADTLDFGQNIPIRTEIIPIERFLTIPPFPGHRNSADRAVAAKHLHTFCVEHLDVDLGEFLDDKGDLRLCRITGNTRAHVWEEGLSDKRPSHVRATIYSYTTADEIISAGLRFDSPQAAWRPKDYQFRAEGLTFDDGWRPVSKTCRAGQMSRVLRLADAYDNLRYVVQSTTTIETVMPRWAREIMLLDAACEMPLAMSGNFSTGMQAATLLLFKYEDPTAVDIFIRMVRQDQGTKTAEGMDGGQQLVEVMKGRAVKSKRGRVNGRSEERRVGKECRS